MLGDPSTWGSAKAVNLLLKVFAPPGAALRRRLGPPVLSPSATGCRRGCQPPPGWENGLGRCGCCLLVWGATPLTGTPPPTVAHVAGPPGPKVGWPRGKVGGSCMASMGKERAVAAILEPRDVSPHTPLCGLTPRVPPPMEPRHRIDGMDGSTNPRSGAPTPQSCQCAGVLKPWMLRSVTHCAPPTPARDRRLKPQMALPQLSVQQPEGRVV